MPRIQELTPGYDYYMDAQDDVRRHGIDAEITSGQEREDAHVRLENDKTYSTVDLPRSLEKLNADHEEAFDIARDEFIRASSDEKKSQIEYDRQREDLYNRLGENWAREQQEYETRIGHFGEEADIQKDAYGRMRDEQEKHFERKMEAISEQHGMETEKIVQDAREQVRQQYRQANQGSDNGGAAAFERKKNAEFDEMNRVRNDELNEVKDREYQHSEQWKLMGRKRDMALEDVYSKSQESLENQQKRSDEDFQTYKNAVKEEQHELYRQNAELSTLKDKYGDGKAEGRQAAVAEMAADKKIDAGRVEDAWKAREAQLQRQNTEIYDGLGRKTSEALRDKENFYTNLIQQTNAEYYDDRASISKRYDENTDQMRESHLDREAAQEERYDEALTRVRDQSNEAMEEQARIFHENYAASKTQDAHDIEELQAKLDHLMSTDDPYAVSPAAAERIRVTLADDHAKTFDAYDEANAAEIGYIQEDAAEHVADLREQLDHEKYRAASTLATKEKEYNDSFVNFSADLTEAKDSAIRRQEMTHERAWEKAYKAFTGDMRYKDRQFSQALEDLKDNNQSKVRDVLTEAQFRERMLRSENQMTQEETIRSYERKIAEQKETLETEMNEMKHAQMTQVRKLEREYQDLLREQEQRHAHEQAAAEFQRKERERYLAQNYEEQLERTQRANARLVQTKS